MVRKILFHVIPFLLPFIAYAHPPREHRARHFIGVTPPGGVPDGLIAALAADNVFVAPRGPSIRISPHLHNDEADIERLFAAFDQYLPR